MATLEDLLTDGAPSGLLDPVTEVLLRDPVRVDDAVYSRSTLVDSGWRHPMTHDALNPNDIMAAAKETAAVEKYISARLHDKIKLLLLDTNAGRMESDVDTLLELLKAFERRSNLECVRNACANLAQRLNALLPYELEMVLDCARASLQSAASLVAFCQNHCDPTVVAVVESSTMQTPATKQQHTQRGGGTNDLSHLGNGVDSMSLGVTYDYGMPLSTPSQLYGYSGGGGGGGVDLAYNGQDDGWHEVQSKKSSKQHSNNSAIAGNTASTYTQGQAAAHSRNTGGRQAAVMATGAGEYSPTAAPAQMQEVFVLQLKGMPNDVDMKQVRNIFHKFQRDVATATMSNAADGTCSISFHFTSYDSACNSMRLLLGKKFEGRTPDMKLETKMQPLARRGTQSPRRPTAKQQPQPRSNQQPPQPLMSIPLPSSSSRQSQNIGKWMYSVWLGNLPRPVSKMYQTDLISVLSTFRNSIVGAHVHAASKGKYLFVDLNSDVIARKMASFLRSRKVNNKDVSSKYSKKRMLCQPGSSHQRAITLFTLFVTNIAHEDIATGFLLDQCQQAHAVDIPMPFKHMAFFQFRRRGDAQRTIDDIKALQQGCTETEIRDLALIVNEDVQDLLVSDTLSDVYEMNQAWDRIHASGAAGKNFDLPPAPKPRPQPQPQQRPPAVARNHLQSNAPAHLQQLEPIAPSPLSGHAGSAVVNDYQHHNAEEEDDDEEEVYQSDEEDFFQLEAEFAAADGREAFAEPAEVAQFSAHTSPLHHRPPASPAALVAAVPPQPQSSSWQPGTTHGNGGGNVCVEGQGSADLNPIPMYSPKYKNYKCFVPLSAVKLAYLTKYFHQQRLRSIGSEFNRLQAKYGAVLQFDRATAKYFFHSQDEEAVSNAAAEMANWSSLSESAVHLCAHQCLLETLTQDILPRISKEHQVYCVAKAAKHSGACKTCEVCRTPPDPATAERYPSLKWDKHDWHVVVSVCGDRQQVNTVIDIFKKYSPLNLSFGLSPTKMERLQQAARGRHGNLSNVFEHLEEKYGVIVFHHAVTFFAVTGMQRAHTISCATSLLEMANFG